MREPDVDVRILDDIARRVLRGSGDLALHRMETGGSTPVYRIRHGDVTLYLRLAEGPDADLAPEVLVHTLLHAQGVRVPEVVHFESRHPLLERSVMVTTEIPGRSLAEHHRGVDVDRALRAAGQDLAVINQVAVDGFGWMRRDLSHGAPLTAEHPTLRAFALDDFETSLSAVASVLNARALAVIRRVIADHDAWLDAGQASLAHGDFDATHIYHQDGDYTGVIDFGEIRGTDRFYDLGHFALHDGEKIASILQPRLIAGYRDVVAIPEEHEARIAFWALLIGLRTLARTAGRPVTSYREHLLHGIRRSLAVLQP
jgi:aminoglycoside phosphotransferase (APT) family kinase protein